MSSAWGDSWGRSWGSSWGLRITVVSQTGSGERRRRTAQGKTALQLLLKRLKEEDEEILAIIIELIRSGDL
jgi:hypothetical protein